MPDSSGVGNVETGQWIRLRLNHEATFHFIQPAFKSDGPVALVSGLQASSETLINKLQSLNAQTIPWVEGAQRAYNSENFTENSESPFAPSKSLKAEPLNGPPETGTPDINLHPAAEET